MGLSDAQVARDDLGRITQRIEVVDGITRVFEYGYELATKTVGSQTTSFGYDTLGSLIRVTGDRSLLDRLPDRGSPKANWKQNSGVLRQEMNKGNPIRDASPGDNTGPFLNAERALLADRGWTFDSSTSLWMPPRK